MFGLQPLIAWFDSALIGEVSNFSSVVRKSTKAGSSQGDLGGGSWARPMLSFQKFTRLGPAPLATNLSPYALSFNASVLRSFSVGAARVNLV